MVQLHSTLQNLVQLHPTYNNCEGPVQQDKASDLSPIRFMYMYASKGFFSLQKPKKLHKWIIEDNLPKARGLQIG